MIYRNAPAVPFEITDERGQAVQPATTIAVGVVPGRTDGVLSVHVGSAFIELSRDEAWDLANELARKSYNKQVPTP